MIRFRFCLSCLLGLLLAGCVAAGPPAPAPVDAPAAADLTLTGVRQEPGAAAWSTDGRWLALAHNNGVTLVRRGDHRQYHHPLAQVGALRWDGNGRLLVLARQQGTRRLVTVIPAAGPKAEAIPLPPDTVDLQVLDHGELLLLTAAVFPARIGTQVRYRIKRLRPDGGTEDLVATTVRYPVRSAVAGLLAGWRNAPRRPTSGDLLVADYHNPPALDPFVLLSTVDPALGEMEPMVQVASRRFAILASWSPDGRRLAFCDDDGYLVVSGPSRAGYFQPLTWDIQGTAPAWHPTNDWIFAGGWLVDSAAPDRRHRLIGGRDALAFWAPDGKAIAVLDHGRLTLYEQLPAKVTIATYPAPAISRAKVSRLRRLLADGVITVAEYRERKHRLLAPLP